MGKTPKKAAPGGDERNLYIRRLKATTNASSSSSKSKSCETNVPVRQRELENPNRSKPIGVQKRLPVPTGKVFKSKLRTPAKTKSHQAVKNPSSFQSTANTENKSSASASTKYQDTNVSTMRPESEEAAVQLKVSITKKDVTDGEKMSETDGSGKEATETNKKQSNVKELIPVPEAENTTPRVDIENEENADNVVEILPIKESVVESHDNGNESVDTLKNNSEIHEEQNESGSEHPSSKCEDEVLKLDDEGESVKSLNDQNNEPPECTTNGQQEKIDKPEREPSQIEKPNLVENCSVDVVESTTTEISETVTVTESEKLRESCNQQKECLDTDVSFVSYDSSIMLKDVQIKLNDCLKDNSKLFDVTNDENSAEQQKRLDMSFGKTLRNISGRNSINRLRYVTLREHRLSPNSSLFVNTSSASLDPEEPMGSKITRYPTDLSDTVKFNNGSPADRKRKLVTDVRESVKKLKIDGTERTSFLNTSLEMLKGIRRPIQMSTPNTKGYKFNSDKYNIKTFSDDKLTIDSQEEPRKWCVVM